MELLKDVLEDKILMWLGHLVRIGDDKQKKKIWEARRGGKHRGGKSRKRWNGDMEHIRCEHTREELECS